MNEETLSDLEDLGEAGNENVGRDLAPYDDEIVFRKHPLIWIPKLDSETTPADPIYMIDKATFVPCVLRGDYMRFADVHKAAKQHNVFVSEVDLSINTICVNRRANAVIYEV